MKVRIEIKQTRAALRALVGSDEQLLLGERGTHFGIEIGWARLTSTVRKMQNEIRCEN